MPASGVRLPLFALSSTFACCCKDVSVEHAVHKGLNHGRGRLLPLATGPCSLASLAGGGTLVLDINKAGFVTYPNQELMTYYGYKFEALCTGAPARAAACACACSAARCVACAVLLALCRAWRAWRNVHAAACARVLTGCRRGELAPCARRPAGRRRDERVLRRRALPPGPAPAADGGGD